MTEMRSEEIATILLRDEEYTKQLLQMSPEEASKKLNNDGEEVSPEELIEFKEGIEKIAEMESKQGELMEDELALVSGGCRRCYQAGMLLGAAGTAIAISYLVW